MWGLKSWPQDQELYAVLTEIVRGLQNIPQFLNHILENSVVSEKAGIEPSVISQSIILLGIRLHSESQENRNNHPIDLFT